MIVPLKIMYERPSITVTLIFCTCFVADLMVVPMVVLMVVPVVVPVIVPLVYRTVDPMVDPIVIPLVISPPFRGLFCFDFSMRLPWCCCLGYEKETEREGEGKWMALFRDLIFLIFFTEFLEFFLFIFGHIEGNFDLIFGINVTLAVSALPVVVLWVM